MIYAGVFWDTRFYLSDKFYERHLLPSVICSFVNLYKLFHFSGLYNNAHRKRGNRCALLLFWKEFYKVTTN